MNYLEFLTLQLSFSADFNSGFEPLSLERWRICKTEFHTSPSIYVKMFPIGAFTFQIDFVVQQNEHIVH